MKQETAATPDHGLRVVLWAYALAIAGMWLTISPWRLRDWIEWATASEARLRIFSAARLAFGLGIILLALFVVRGAEKKPVAATNPAAGAAPAALRA